MPLRAPESTLAERTLALVDIPSRSHEEEGVYRYVKEHVPLPVLYDDGEAVLYGLRAAKPLVLLAGHTEGLVRQVTLCGRDPVTVAGLVAPRRRRSPN